MDKNIVNKLLEQPNLESSHITQLLTIATMADDRNPEPTPSPESNSSVEVVAVDEPSSPWVLPEKGQKCLVISHPDPEIFGAQDDIPTVGSTVYISDITTLWMNDVSENKYGVLVTKRKSKPEEQMCHTLTIDDIRPI